MTPDRKKAINGKKVLPLPRKKLHYSWVVCVLGAVLLYITMGVTSNVFPVFLPYVIEQSGLTGTQGSFLITLRCLVSLGAMLVIERYYKLLRLRAGLCLAAVLAGASFCLYGVSRSYFCCCAASVLCGLGYGFGTMIPLSMLMHNWFHAHRALALGICTAGSGFATFTLPPVTTLMIERHSLSYAFLAEGFAVFAVSAVIFLLLRESPADMGLKPLGEGTLSAQQPQTAPAVFGRGPSGWALGLLLAANLLMGGVACTGSAHLAVLFDSEGFAPMTVSLVMSVLGLVGIPAKLLFGALSDKMGGRSATFLFAGVLTFAHGLCCLADAGSVPLAFLTAVLLGCGYPIVTIGASVWASDMASPERFAGLVRRMQVFYAAGSLLFSVLPGVIYDHVGSYVPAFVLFTVSLAVMLGMLAVCYHRTTPGRSERLSPISSHP